MSGTDGQIIAAIVSAVLLGLGTVIGRKWPSWQRRFAAWFGDRRELEARAQRAEVLLLDCRAEVERQKHRADLNDQLAQGADNAFARLDRIENEFNELVAWTTQVVDYALAIERIAVLAGVKLDGHMPRPPAVLAARIAEARNRIEATPEDKK